MLQGVADQVVEHPFDQAQIDLDRGHGGRCLDPQAHLLAVGRELELLQHVEGQLDELERLALELPSLEVELAIVDFRWLFTGSELLRAQNINLADVHHHRVIVGVALAQCRANGEAVSAS